MFVKKASSIANQSRESNLEFNFSNFKIRISDFHLLFKIKNHLRILLLVRRDKNLIATAWGRNDHH
jgi:hypothetical protein